MDKRLMKIIAEKKHEFRGGCCLDTYNQTVHYDYFPTIRTNINTANHHFIVCEE